MHNLYIKFMTWLAGEAVAHSDRIQIAVKGGLGIIVAQILPKCSVCSSFLTPELMDKLSATIAAFAITLIASVTVRDVVAPEKGAGEAVKQ